MKIMLREDKTKKWELVESNQYALEKELQDLLATSPEVISMDEIRPGSGPLVAAIREFSLPVGFIDILAFTSQGDISIIECKLARNTQTKREVIGQIMDYAAHLWGWTYEELDQRVQSMGLGSLTELVGGKTEGQVFDEEAFRTKVSQCLQDGNFLLTIAVNEINEELHRIIRYINSAGSPAFSFAALEMRRFNKANIEMLVPHVFGQVPAKPTIVSNLGFSWDEESFFTELGKKDSGAVPIAKYLLDWAQNCKLDIWWGRGKQMGSFYPVFLHDDKRYPLFGVWTYSRVETQFESYKTKTVFSDHTKRMTLRDLLNKVNGVQIEEKSIDKRPSFSIHLLKEPAEMEKFLAAYDWFFEQVKTLQ
jgi:hypothetical protein